MSDATQLEALELKLAFLEDAHAKLDDVVRDQHQRITHLEGVLKKLVEEYRELRDLLQDEQGDAPPPHY